MKAIRLKATELLAPALAATFFVGAMQVGTAQESVIYSFQSGSSDGQSPNGGPAIDREGNVYGTTSTGGAHGSGIVYELSPPSQSGGEWTETVIYNFGDVPAAGGSPGITGQGGTVILDGNGNLYGTATGGVSNESGKLAAGVVYELSPPQSASGEWTAQALYTFIDDSATGLRGPNGAVVFDKEGNLYGIANGGGAYSNGGVFELSPPAQTGDEWTMTPIYSFNNSSEAAQPWGPGANASLIVDAQGNLYGTTQYGGAKSSGTVYQLSPSASEDGSWTAAILHSFAGVQGGDGYGPEGSLILDAKGNLYGTTGAQGLYSGGIVFELSPPAASGGQWVENVLDNFHAFSATDGSDPTANVVFDPQGNLWGTTYRGGPSSTDSHGVIFELIPQPNGGWIEATPMPYFFGSQTNDVYYLDEPIVIDGRGNIYSTGSGGANVCNGTSTCGAVWEFTPPAPVITLSFAPAPGVYSTAQTVSISDSLPGSAIYYTTDGTAPTIGSNLFGGTIKVSKNTTIKAIAVHDTDTSAVASASYVIQAAIPMISPPGGTYSGPRAVTITDATPGAVIHYTTNGQTPNAASAIYTKAFEVTATETISALAIAAGRGNSPVAKAKFTVEKPAATPIFSPAAGKYPKGQLIKITDATPHAVIHYTTNGTLPTAASAKYSAEIMLSANLTIKAIAVAAGYTNSAPASAIYTVEKAAATPVITPDGGPIVSGKTVTITDATKGATLYYTTNGTIPTARSARYNAAIKVTGAETIRAVAIATGYSQSAVASAKFTIE